MLLRRANAKGITVVRLLVESALAEDGGEIASDRRALMVDLFAAHRTLASLGNNVNQIAKATNAEGGVPGELVEPLRHTLDAVRAAAAVLTDAIEELPKP
ncbi:plasmid mobilization relaxosome protein MobC [Microbacterium sp.]|uniref:plasmid mobilization relaxosome protein MobC n=1 Tax=Microbacterium sp. TaxID=51671 RepID=UPI003F9A0B89